MWVFVIFACRGRAGSVALSGHHSHPCPVGRRELSSLTWWCCCSWERDAASRAGGPAQSTKREGQRQNGEMGGCGDGEMLWKGAPHRHSSVSFSIPSVTLQLSAPAFSISILSAHAHTRMEHAAPVCTWGGGAAQREKMRELEENGRGKGEQKVCCANAVILCCRMLTWNANENSSTNSEQAATLLHFLIPEQQQGEKKR